MNYNGAYSNQKRPAEIEMSRYNNSYQPNNNYPPHEQAKNNPEQQRQNTEATLGGLVLHYVVFIVAFAINFGAWIVDYNLINHQASNFYKASYYAVKQITGSNGSDSAALYTTDPFDTIGYVIGLVYSWVLWKGPLLAFSYKLIHAQESTGLKIGSFIAYSALLLIIDVVCTVFLIQIYNEMIYFGVYTIFTAILAMVNGGEKKGQAFQHSTIPLGLISGIIAIYCLILPTLYKFYYDRMSNMETAFMIIYLYPVIDLLIFVLTLKLGTGVKSPFKSFFAMLHYLLIGYGVGMILLVGYTEVQFYYLIAYFIFRNIFVNYILRGFQQTLSLPPALPAWIIIYYVSYAVSFIPVIGVGKIVVSYSFTTFLWAKVSTILYGIANPLYPFTTAPTGTAILTNFTLQGNIFWLAAAIIWVAMTVTQKPLTKRISPSLYDFFYYLVGIRLFYYGIICSLNLYTMTLYTSLLG